MLPSADLKSAGGVFYVSFPAITISANAQSPGVATEQVYEEVLSALGDSSTAMRLRETEFWGRAFAPKLLVELNALGAAPELQHLTSCGNRTVPTGVVHGDLWKNNVVLEEGKVRLIDWDRWEQRSPHFFDVAAAAFAVWRKDRVLNGMKDFIALVAAEDSRVPFIRRLQWASGELTMAEAISFKILSDACWRRIDRPFESSADQRLRAYIHVCTGLIQDAGSFGDRSGGRDQP